MKSSLSHLPSICPATTELRGYSYAPVGKPAKFVDAVAGLTVGTFTDEPPWIVVDLSLTSVVVNSWPGKLWEVQILRSASEQPRQGAGYVRATAVRLERELPSASLFGLAGLAVEGVLGRALQLTTEQRDELARFRSTTADEAFSAAWNRWLAEVDPANPHRGQDHRDTLAIPSSGLRSPIGFAFTVLHSVLVQRARELEGSAAFVPGDEELRFTPIWASAFASLLHACMAVGTTANLLSEDERSALVAGYASVNAGHSAP